MKATTDPLLDAVRQAIASAPAGKAIQPGHRVPFHWPPHPVSADFHVLPHDWRERDRLLIGDEEFEVEFAPTSNGLFGRLVGVWNEARGATKEDVCQALVEGAQPLLRRQAAAAAALGLRGRLQRPVRGLPPEHLVRLLYCEDRDVVHEAMVEIEAHASTTEFGPALLEILRDRAHPMRRSAQWAVLDMLEDMDAFFRTPEARAEAVDAVRGILVDAEDDYCRTVFKAGVVLGGHVSDAASADALLACIGEATPIGRRSAIHAVFHLVEWRPEDRERVLAALGQAAETDSEPLLRSYASAIAQDIAAGGTDHVAEPVLPGEA
jgi:hypothetical protein